MKNKLYILIDKNLDPIYGAVQGGHAIAEWLLENWLILKNGDPEWNWNNDYLIYLSADIDEWYQNLMTFDPNHSQWTHFTEPDLDNKLTAIAIHESSIVSDRFKGQIKKLKLWGT